MDNTCDICGTKEEAERFTVSARSTMEPLTYYGYYVCEACKEALVEERDGTIVPVD